MIDPELIHDYLDRNLDPQRTRELADWLLENPKNRASFRQEVDLAVELAVAMRKGTPKLHDFARVVGQDSGRKPKRHKRSKSPLRATLNYWALYAALAAMIALCVTVALVELNKSDAQNKIVVVQESPSFARPLSLFKIVGNVSIERGGKLLAEPLASVRELFIGDVVRTGVADASQLEIDNGMTRLYLAPNTTLVIRSIRENEQRRGTTFGVNNGSLLIEAAPQPSETPLRLLTARSDVEIVGTVVSLEIAPLEDRITVGHGAVSVSDLSHSQRHVISMGDFCLNDGINIKTQTLGKAPPNPVTTSEVVSITLIDLMTAKPIPGYEKMISGVMIDLAKFNGGRINFLAKVKWAPGEEDGFVAFSLNDRKPILEDSAPFELLKRDSGLLSTSDSLSLSNGAHCLVVTPYFDPVPSKGTWRELSIHGKPGRSAILIFTLINAH